MFKINQSCDMFSFFSKVAEKTKKCFTSSINSWFVFYNLCYSPIDFLSSYIGNILFKIKNEKNIVDPINETMC